MFYFLFILGYFRTSYDNNNWQSLISFLQNSNFDKISPINRAALIEDSFTLAKSGTLTFDIYLELTKYLIRETDYIPIYSFIKTANYLKSLFVNTNILDPFMKHCRNLIQHMYDRIGTSFKPNEEHFDTLSRIKILRWLCDFGFDRCQNEMYKVLSESTSSIDPNLQELIYCGGMRLGNLKEFSFLIEQHNLYQKSRVLISMGCTSNIGLLRF